MNTLKMFHVVLVSAKMADLRHHVGITVYVGNLAEF